jgi:elongation factor Ts
LLKAGIAKAAKKAGRSATEGRIISNVRDGSAAMVEVLCETDFVARNEKFSDFSQDLVKRIVEDYDADGDVSELVAEEEKEELVALIAVIGENMQTRRAVRWNGTGSFASYLHMGGKIGVLVEAEGDASDELLNDICMHVAAFNPRYVAPEDVPAEAIEKEKEIARAQVQGKPENIMDKIVDGKINKWYSEVCLTRQPWLRDDKSCLAKVAPGLKVKRYLRWTVGEEL